MCYRLVEHRRLRRPVSIQGNSSRPKDLSAALWQAEPERDRLQRLCRLPAATTVGTAHRSGGDGADQWRGRHRPCRLHYYRRFEPGADDAGVIRFLLTAAAIGMLYKQNASISGARWECQGEVGVACSMAAAGLVSALNGSNEQIENAAEIGMEHNLG